LQRAVRAKSGQLYNRYYISLLKQKRRNNSFMGDNQFPIKPNT